MGERNALGNLMSGGLTKSAIKNRLFVARDLVVAPLLEETQIGDGSIDISLGPRFIIGHRAEQALIDPKSLTQEQIRKFQREIIVPFGQEFILHPHSFALACTFEFIALPRDLCGFVLSRSSYGRAGLLVATATYVHPCWRGCLTLELENLGDVPIVLRPGSAVGQLVLFSALPLEQEPLLKSIPVGPTFASLADDPRWKKLERLKQS
jgi:dCTP deaminase